jgi:hypothetical protein
MQSIAEIRAAVKEQELIVKAKTQALHIENTRLNGLVKKLQDTILKNAEELRKSKISVNKDKIPRLCNTNDLY